MNNMTPSTMTDGQIDKAVANYRAMLCKHRHEFDSRLIQQALGSSEFAARQLTVLRKCTEEIGNMIVVRHVKVDRSRTPQAMLHATGREISADEEVVASMPRGDGEEVDVYFFRIGYFISDVDLDKEYELRGLRPADPYSYAAVDEIDPDFADKHPNGTHWRGPDGKWCYAAFDRGEDGERDLYLSRFKGDWGDDWWFAGLRK